jgi:hypothetical protein
VGIQPRNHSFGRPPCNRRNCICATAFSSDTYIWTGYTNTKRERERERERERSMIVLFCTFFFFFSYVKSVKRQKTHQAADKPSPGHGTGCQSPTRWLNQFLATWQINSHTGVGSPLDKSSPGPTNPQQQPTVQSQSVSPPPI